MARKCNLLHLIFLCLLGPVSTGSWGTEASGIWLEAFKKVYPSIKTCQYDFESVACGRSLVASAPGIIRWETLPVQGRIKGHISVSPQQAYLREVYENAGNTSSSQEIRTEFWDGKNVWSAWGPADRLLCPSIYTVARVNSHDSSFTFSNASDFLDGRISALPFRDWAVVLEKAARLEISSATQFINGFHCRLVQGQYGPAIFKFWVDESHGYRYRQAEVTLLLPPPIPRWKRWIPVRKPESVQRIDFRIQDVSLQDKMPFLPLSGIAQITTLMDSGARSISSITVNRSHLSFERPPDHAVQDDFPDDVLVNDRTIGLTYIHRKGRISPFVNLVLLQRTQDTVLRVKDLVKNGKLSLTPHFISPGATPSGSIESSSTLGQLDAPLPSQDLNNPQSDLYCLYLALRLAGKPVAMMDLLQPKNIVAQHNSTYPVLARLAVRNGLTVRPSAHLNTSMLAKFNLPVVLHTKRTRTSKRYDSYELFLGMQSGQAFLFTVDEGVRSEPLAALTARWDGSGLILARQPISNLPILGSLILRYSGIMGLGLLLIFPLGLVLRRRIVHRAVSGVFRASIVQFLWFILLTSSFAFCWHRFRPEGFLARADAIAPIKVARIGYFLPQVDLSKIIRIIRGEDSSVIIDARDKPSYYKGHIPGALSIPIDEIESMRRDLERFKPESHFVIYCGSEECGIARRMSAQMYNAGFTQLEIYRGGWQEWARYIDSQADTHMENGKGSSHASQ